MFTVKASLQNAVIMLFCDRGGFAVVHRCVHKVSNRDFAVKVINVANMRKKGIMLSCIYRHCHKHWAQRPLESYTRTRTLIKLTTEPSKCRLCDPKL